MSGYLVHSIPHGKLISHYAKAREKAFTRSTIQNAFRKCGIWPFNPKAIEVAAFAPALNTTTQSAQPVATTVPDFVVVVTQRATPTAIPITMALSSSLADTPTASAVNTSTSAT